MLNIFCLLVNFNQTLDIAERKNVTFPYEWHLYAFKSMRVGVYVCIAEWKVGSVSEPEVRVRLSSRS